MNTFLNMVAAGVILAATIGSVNGQFIIGSICIPDAGNPAIVRVEGTTELMGDLVLTCSGGTSTASGQPVPLVNVTLTFNTNVTSRLLGGGYMDALLTIDEPYPSTIVIPPQQQYLSRPPNSPDQNLCYSSSNVTPGSCNYLLGTGGGGYGTANSPYLQPNASTIYAAQQGAPNQIAWYGVPIDPPGPSAQRKIRLTNVRANAQQLGLSSTLIPTQIECFVQVSGSQYTINNPQQTLAYIQQGMIASNTPLDLCGCPSHNASLLGGPGTPGFDASIQVSEGFAWSFKRRNIGVTVDGPTAPSVYPQNVPGSRPESETGFLPSPLSIAPFQYALSAADSGTRILLAFINAPPDVHVFVPVTVVLPHSSPDLGYPPGNLFDTAELQLIQTQENGFSGTAYTSLPSTAIIGSTPVAEASRVGNILYATYEIVDSDLNAIETATIPVALAYNASTNLFGSIVAQPSLAPVSSFGVAAGASQPIPRFALLNVSPPPTPGDFDSSSVSDRVWQNDSNGQVTVHYYGYAGKTFEGWNFLSTTIVPNWHVVAVADFNGDGIPDLVWQDDVTREVTVHYFGGLGGAVFQGWNFLHSTPAPGWRVVAAADFNGDGVPDLVWQNDTTRQLTVHYFGGTAGAVLQSWNFIDSRYSLGWSVAGAGDFNRDGVPDLVFQNDTTRQVTVHYMGGPQGATFQSWKWLNNQGSPGWTIKAVSDVNGDGVPDLLWQNDATHQVTVHHYGGIGGASFQSWDWISQPGVPGWSIAN